jgi:hypothetical protein
MNIDNFIHDVNYWGQSISDFDTLDILPGYLKDFYLKQNGLIAFHGGLHIRGCVNEPDWHSLKEVWFGNTKLSLLFDSIEINDIPIAQDCFGDQFIIRDKSIWLLSAETDEIKNLEVDFLQFTQQAFTDTSKFLNIENIQHLDIKPGQLINVVPPFCVNSKSGYSFRPIDSFEQIRYLSSFSKEIKNLPNGTSINLKTD